MNSFDNEVSAIPVRSYDASLMEEAVEKHFELFRADEIIKPDMKVCVKPNLLMKAGAKEAVTTHPALVAAVIRKLKAMGAAEIVVADSPGGPYTKSILEGIYRASGIDRAAMENGAALNFDTGFIAKPAEGAVICREFNIINPVAEADIVINLPKLKTHGMVMLSAGVKNLFGCIPGLQKPEFHFRFKDQADFCRMLLDLSRLAAPALTIVDAVDSMEGNGPSGGKVRHTGMTFAARNIYALDLALCDYIGFPPGSVPTVKLAMDSGLCPASGSDIRWLGEKPSFLKDFLSPDSRPVDFAGWAPGFLKKPASFVLERIFGSKPAIIREKCVGCGKCEESCAPGAAVIRDRKAVIDYKKCIKCYCCHELCPVRAVRIKKSFIMGG